MSEHRVQRSGAALIRVSGAAWQPPHALLRDERKFKLRDELRDELSFEPGHKHPHARRLALVCEGGGQRGIFTAGILDRFIEHDYFPFQLLIGASAGAQNLSAYACAAHGYARDAILGYTTRKEFYDPLRFARGGHLIDLDWYFDILQQQAPLDIERAGRRLQQRSLLLCATRRDTLDAAYLPFERAGLRQAVKASSAIPLFYRGGVSLDGVVFWDGGVADALPVRAAHARGADCIIVIRTVPPVVTGTRVVDLSTRLCRGRLRPLGALARRHLQGYRAAQDFIACPPEAVSVVELAPARPLASRLLGSTPQALLADYRSGQACGQAFLEQLAWRLDDGR